MEEGQRRPFRPELEVLAGLHGLQIVASGEWLTDRPADASTWSVWFALRHAPVA